jgi:pimeloyl-ACP methyl ester carboxylesterase
MTIKTTRVQANGMTFECLTAGDSGPLALCLHGFPDTAHGWRHLLPALADAGYQAVAPFMRGYGPSDVPSDGSYQTGALALDAVALHEALGGDGDAVLIGHDWGALAVYAAAAAAPERWRRVVAAAVPPAPAMAAAFLSYEQIKRSGYMFFFQLPFADFVVPMNDFDYIDQLWRDWSPGYDCSEDMTYIRSALGTPENLTAALGYYRVTWGTTPSNPEIDAQQATWAEVPPQPTLYLHGRNDGCIGVEFGEIASEGLSTGSRVAIIENAGHFTQSEQPAEFNRLVLEFLAEH